MFSILALLFGAFVGAVCGMHYVHKMYVEPALSQIKKLEEEKKRWINVTAHVVTHSSIED